MPTDTVVLFSMHELVQYSDLFQLSWIRPPVRVLILIYTGFALTVLYKILPIKNDLIGITVYQS